METLKAWFAWLYNWVTVIAGVAIGGLTSALEALDWIGIADWTAYLPPQQALKIVFAVAMLKGFVSYWNSRSA